MGNKVNEKLALLLLFLGPALLCVVVLRLWPAVLAIRESLVDPTTGKYGLSNYVYILTDPDFIASLKATLLFSIIVNPLQIAIALALALLTNAALPLIGLW